MDPSQPFFGRLSQHRLMLGLTLVLSLGLVAFALTRHFICPKSIGPLLAASWILLGILSSQSRNAFIGLSLGIGFLIWVGLKPRLNPDLNFPAVEWRARVQPFY